MERNIPKHIAIILDGNGRWAKARGQIRTFGHKAGYNNIEPVALYAQSIGVEALSMYCFSTENWNRPKAEVDFLMQVPVELSKNIDRYIKNNIKVVFSGRKNVIPEKTLNALNLIESRTSGLTGMTLNICFDYGALDDVMHAINEIKKDNVTLDEKTIYKYLYTKDLPPVDLLIRPGGEKRLSNFMLLELAYAELYFVDTYWPDFGTKDLDLAIDDFNKRNRRFGGIKE